MDPQIRRYLKSINRLSVNTALWVMRQSFNEYYLIASQTAVGQIEAWVNSTQDQKLTAIWGRQKQRRYPHMFLYWLIIHHKYRSLGVRNYQREVWKGRSLPDSDSDFKKYPAMAKKISRHVLRLPFYEGAFFLGELTGAWMQTCPEALIHAGNSVEIIGKWRVGKETRDWEISPFWIEQIPESNRAKITEKEMRLLYVLDFMLYSIFEDFEASNI